MEPKAIFNREQRAERWPNLTYDQIRDVMTTITDELRDRWAPPKRPANPKGLDAYLDALLGGRT